MEVDSAAARRERSPETSEDVIDERPSKKPRIEEIKPTTGAEGSSKSVSKKGSKFNKRAMQKLVHPEEGTPDDVLWHEVKEILGESVVDDAVFRKVDLDAPLKFGDVLELDVVAMSSNGDSLCQLEGLSPWLVITPFALTGERIRVKIVRNGRMVSYADLLEVLKPNETLRDMSRVKCEYFGKCAGCQYQMLDYSTQLDLKQRVVEKAYRYFSAMASDMIPSPLPTIGSPLQYGYRTKITPHFDAPPKGKARDNWEPWIGFDSKNRRKVLDIEECPIATPVLNAALGPARQKIKENIDTYKRGSTLLMRDSLETDASNASGEGEEKHICIQDHKATVRERVGGTLFEFPANSFFQNNNSVLVPLTEYVRTAILSPPDGHVGKKPKHLVDTYCGSGLFAITLSPFFESVVGIEISEESIRSARHNVSLNNIAPDKCVFRAGKAEAIFSVVQELPPDETVIVIDPPRKGCDDKFIEQLLLFGAGTVVYVSCNVHTQARDVGKIVRGGGGYVLESLRGFDLFPQTAHVESVAVLRKRV